MGEIGHIVPAPRIHKIPYGVGNRPIPGVEIADAGPRHPKTNVPNFDLARSRLAKAAGKLLRCPRVRRP